MKTTVLRSALLAGLGLLLAASTVQADDLPSFKKRGDMEKTFVTKVGTAIVQAARTKPGKLEYDKHEVTDVDTHLKEMKIIMTWTGGITKKKYVSTIVLTLYTKDKEAWRVLDIDYKDDSVSVADPNYKKIRELKTAFNK
jgi:hypothetical protein